MVAYYIYFANESMFEYCFYVLSEIHTHERLSLFPNAQRINE